jgi:hypothetical protein
LPLAKLLNIVSADQALSLEIPCTRLRAQGLDVTALVTQIVCRSRAYLNSR